MTVHQHRVYLFIPKCCFLTSHNYAAPIIARFIFAHHKILVREWINAVCFFPSSRPSRHRCWKLELLCCVMTIWCIVFKSIHIVEIGAKTIDKVVNLLVYIATWIMDTGKWNLRCSYKLICSASCSQQRITDKVSYLRRIMLKITISSFPSCFLFFTLCVFRYTASESRVAHCYRIDLFDFLIFPTLSEDSRGESKNLFASSTKLINHVNDSFGKIQRDTSREFIVFLLWFSAGECEHFTVKLLAGTLIDSTMHNFVIKFPNLCSSFTTLFPLPHHRNIHSCSIIPTLCLLQIFFLFLL